MSSDSTLSYSPSEMEKIGRVFENFGKGEKFLEEILKVWRGFENFRGISNISEGFQKLYMLLMPGSGRTATRYAHVYTSFTLRSFVPTKLFVIDLSNFHGLFHLQPLSKFQNKIHWSPD